MTTSPFNCIQEIVKTDDDHYPWRVMCTCILLNQTHGRQVRPILDEFFEILPMPSRLMVLTTEDKQRLRELLKPLGFVNKRMNTLHRNALDYINHVPLHECFGIGKYGRDAIDLFVYGKLDVKPTDKWLQPYLEWRRSGGAAVEWARGMKHNCNTL